MGNPAGVRRDFEKLEQRRLEAAELLRQGFHQAEVARRVGVHRQSVSRWAEELERGGKRALRKAGRAGRRPHLHAEDLRRIEKGLKRGPEALGYETSLWTSWRVAHLIEHECGVQYHPSQAWRILRQLPWSWTKTKAGNGNGNADTLEAARLAMTFAVKVAAKQKPKYQNLVYSFPGE